MLKPAFHMACAEDIIPLPRITPHVFRHTFCTNMANAGVDLILIFN